MLPSVILPRMLVSISADSDPYWAVAAQQQNERRRREYLSMVVARCSSEWEAQIITVPGDHPKLQMVGV